MAGQQQADCSLPATRPVGEYLAELSTLFSLPAGGTPVVWTLSTPRHGLIAPTRSLDDVGVLDGDILYLSPEHEAAEAPLVDDVLATLTASTDASIRPWSDVHRDRVMTSLLAAVTVFFTTVIVATSVTWVGALLLFALFAGCITVANRLRERGGLMLGWAALPASAATLFLVTSAAELNVRLTAGASGALFGMAVIGFAVHRSRAIVVAGAVAGATALIAMLLLPVGIEGTALSAWASPLLVLSLGVLPQIAIQTSGLLGLVRRSEGGNSLQRGHVRRAFGVGQSTVEGLVMAISIAGVAATTTLVLAGRPAQAVLGALLALIFLLRSRSFSAAIQVGFMLAVPLSALLATAAALPNWLEIHDALGGSMYWALAALTAAALVAIGYIRLPEVTAAHFANFFDRVDTIAVLALVPVVLLAQGIFERVANQ